MTEPTSPERGNEPTAPLSLGRDALALQDPALFIGILEIAADAIVTVDEEQCIVLFNSGAQAIFGYSPAEIVGQSLDVLIPEHFRAGHRHHIHEFARSPVAARRMGERREIFGRRKNGELFPAEASISKIEIGDRRYFTAVLRDVTDRQRAQEEREDLLLREREARGRAEEAERRAEFFANSGDILNASLDYQETLRALARLIVPHLAEFAAVDVVDEDGRVQRLDAVHADPARSALASAFGSFQLDRSRPHMTARALETGHSVLIADVTSAHLEAWAQNAEHLAMLRALGLASFIAVPLIAHARTLGAFAMGRGPEPPPFGELDVAVAEELARRAALAVDNALLYRQAQRATHQRDEMLGIVSHDLRNPLSAISMCASTMLELPPASLPAQAEELGRTIQSSAEWMQRMIQDLLDVGSIEAGRLSLERQPEDLFVLIHQILAMFERSAAERSIVLGAELPEDLPRIHADAERVLQVMGNLVGNALKFVGRGGSVIVRASARDDVVEVVVADTGPGIPADELPRIFDRFWHARRLARTRGTGLGLTIAKGIVEAHGGEIRVESAVGVGSAFTFTLPRAPK